MVCSGDKDVHSTTRRIGSGSHASLRVFPGVLCRGCVLHGSFFPVGFVIWACFGRAFLFRAWTGFRVWA